MEKVATRIGISNFQVKGRAICDFKYYYHIVTFFHKQKLAKSLYR